MAKIAIVGAGWYGCHIALELAKAGHEVTIYDENDDLFRGLSGEFGIRLHRGPHYPRSKQTRESCHRGFEEFVKTYPELVIPNLYSLYSLGKLDADGRPSKVDAETFKNVCFETEGCRSVDPKSMGYEDIISAYDLDEPSIAVGTKLRETFRQKLAEAGIKTVFGHKVENLQQKGEKVVINGKEYDEVVNATSYQSLLPSPLIVPIPDTEVVYQPCLALVYEDNESTPAPISRITMDGSYPCIMPWSDGLEDQANGKRKYIVTHGKYTIAGSFPTPEAAQNLLNKLFNDSTFIDSHVRPNSEAAMNHFWPDFKNRFKYCGWKGKVVPKFKTDREFRSAVTYKTNIINIIPGKVSNIFDAAREVLAFVEHKNIVQKEGYSYIKGGELDVSLHEIIEKPTNKFINTADIQTYEEWFRRNVQARIPDKVQERLSNTVLFDGQRRTGSLPQAQTQPPTTNYCAAKL